MRVAVYHSNSDVRVEQRPRPQIGPGELLLSVRASGICGSDVMEWYRLPKAPLVLGHEIAGVVEEVGPGVDRFRRGDRVVATHHVPCNTCRYCLTDRHNVCATLHGTNFDPGGFSELLRLPAINVDRGTFRLPDHVTFEEGSFVEPLACAVRGQRVAGLRAGDDVAVLGSGISGILHVQLARALGAGRILATDVSRQRLEMARRNGADAAIAADELSADLLRRSNEGRLADRVLVCTGARRAFEQALDLVEPGGTILFFAPLEPGQTLPVPVNDLWKRNVSLVHSYAGPPADMSQALDLIAARRVDVASMITHRLGLGQTGEGFRLTVEGGESLKVVVDPQH
ncbi:MAG: alcohol dehydrogenase catalytic domain-containing protein [bacterium]|nr:alcohol dehydrogenase catalytic domain-containing protein [bacterium]